MGLLQAWGGARRGRGAAPPPLLGSWQLSPRGLLGGRVGCWDTAVTLLGRHGGAMLRLPGLCWGGGLCVTTGPSSWRVWLWGSRG